MEVYELSKGIKLFLQDDALIVSSENDMITVSSAVYNGGFRQAKFLLNVHVPEDYNQFLLHKNPEHLVLKKISELNLPPEKSVGMITAADMKNFSMVTKCTDDLRVSAIATAGCSNSETAGEPIDAFLSPGTINVMVIIHGQPTESCLLQAFTTAVEAKTAGLVDLDVRSKYSGDLATGTITDSLIVASTNIGSKVRFSGPASKLGKLVGYCTREAVKNSVIKQSSVYLNRPLLERFAERQLPIDDFLNEILGACSTGLEREKIKMGIFEELKKPFPALILMMAANMDDNVRKGLIPKEFRNLDELVMQFKENLLKIICNNKHNCNNIQVEKIDFEMHPFLKSTLVCITEAFLSQHKQS